MTLTPRQLSEVCLLGSDNPTKTCRYLVNDELDESKWYCQKLRDEAKRRIDEDVDGIGKRAGARLGIPMGDNCCGYPLLKHIQQGFDVD